MSMDMTSINDTFINKANKLHNYKYNYSKFNYINAKTKSIIICPKHGEFLKDPHHHLRKDSKYSGCLVCNKEFSDIERKKKYMKQFIEKANKIHNNKYNYSKFNYINAKTKSIIVCHEHGEFLQCTDGHLTGHGCKKCAVIDISNYHRKSNEIFIKEANEKHNNKYDYSKVNYINCKTNVVIICPDHGEFEQSPLIHINSHGCRKCGKIIGSNKYKEYCINNQDKLAEVGAKKIKKTAYKFIEEANKKHNNKYDYSKVIYKKAIENVIIICQKHGEFEQTPNSHLCGSGCIKCSRIKNGQQRTKEAGERFIKESNKKHNNKYDYSKFKYIKSDIKSIIICPEHGEFEQTPNKHLQGGCMKCGLILLKQTCIEKYACNICKLFYVYPTSNNYNGICRICKQGINKIHKTKELQVVRKLKEDLPDHSFIHNRSVGNECTLLDRNENTNGHLYPDIRFDLPYFQLIVEIDEFKHRGASYSCDERRMYEIAKQLGWCCVFIRYNPDDKKSNYDKLLQMVKEYLHKSESEEGRNSVDFNEHSGLKVEYLFYD